jgi:hypothetical protein
VDLAKVLGDGDGFQALSIQEGDEGVGVDEGRWEK